MMSTLKKTLRNSAANPMLGTCRIFAYLRDMCPTEDDSRLQVVASQIVQLGSAADDDDLTAVLEPLFSDNGIVMAEFLGVTTDAGETEKLNTETEPAAELPPVERKSPGFFYRARRVLINKWTIGTAAAAAGGFVLYRSLTRGNVVEAAEAAAEAAPEVAEALLG